MMSVRVVLNGYNVPDEEVSGENGITVIYTAATQGASGGPAKRISGTLRFSGHAAQMIKDELIDTADGKLRSLPLLIYDTCTKAALGYEFLLFEGAVKGDGIDWCDDRCEIEADPVEENQETDKDDCIRSTLVTDNWNGFTNNPNFVRVVYCDELRPEWLQYVLMIHVLSTMFIVMSFYPLIVLFSPIVDFLNTLGANLDYDGDPNTGSVAEFENAVDLMVQDMMDCGRRHPTPMVRDYIMNVCDKCGLTFDSTILNNPSNDYWNLLYFNADAKQGFKPQDNTAYLLENRPVKTLDIMLDDLCTAFNGAWRREGNKVRFERKDKLQGVAMWLNTETLKAEGRMEDGVCYNWQREDKAALLEIQYTPDAIDIVANEAHNEYTEIVEWNQPVSRAQRGINSKLIRFGGARFRNDGIERDVLSEFAWFPPISGVINTHEKVLLLNAGIASQPKLLIWDGANVQFGTIRQYDIPGWPVPLNQNFNWPMQLNQHNVAPHTAYPTDEPNMALYGRFHAIDNPRIILNRGWDFKFTFRYNPTHLTTFDLWKYIQLPHGKGDIGEVVINPSQGTIIVTGKV